MKVELPFLAEGVEGGDVVQILVHEGEQVSIGQSLIEIETEKATVPVPSPAAGTVTRLFVRQSDHVTVGQALIELDGSAGETLKATPSPPERPANRPVPQPSHTVAPKQAGPAAPPPEPAQQASPRALPS